MFKGSIVKQIVCTGLSNQIGLNGDIPFKSDLSYFRDRTIGRPVIMGRKTYESIGKPLPGRSNIVLSKSLISIDGAEGVCIEPNLYSALISAEYMVRGYSDKTIWIIGGESVYRDAMPYTDEIEMSIVDYDGAADSYYPNLELYNKFNLESDICRYNKDDDFVNRVKIYSTDEYRKHKLKSVRDCEVIE